MERIAIDMDEVMADTLGNYLKRYNRDFNTTVTKADLHGRRPFDISTPEQRDVIFAYFEDATFFSEIDVMPDAQETIRELSKHYEVFVTTAAMDVPCSFTAKFEWLKLHFPELPSSHIVFCGDKSIIAADYLIDDNIRHLTNFRGEGIIFTSPHNMGETRFRRVDSWKDVHTMFLSVQTLNS